MIVLEDAAVRAHGQGAVWVSFHELRPGVRLVDGLRHRTIAEDHRPSSMSQEAAHRRAVGALRHRSLTNDNQ